MGNLPVNRLRESRLFRVSGVEFCGPFYVSYRIRGKRPVKMYVAVFVCFSSKAVHLELVTDLWTEAFLNVLKRFIGRRGLPETLFSDNATDYAAERGVQKHFIPP